MKYLITEKQRDAILGIPGYSNLKDSIRVLKPIEPLSDEQIYAIWPYPEGTNSVQTLARAVEAHILGEKHDRK